MKKNLAFLLAVVLAFSCLLGLSATAAEPSNEIAMVTVPMRATVSILYAVEAAGYADSAAVSVVITAKDGNVLDEAEAAKNLGVYQIDGVDYILFEYSNLEAADMEVEVTAKVEGGNSTVTYSVAKFAEEYVAQYAGNADYAEEVKLVNSMIAYGEAVAAMKKN